MRKNLIYIIAVLMLVGIVLAEITFVSTTPSGGTIISTVDTHTATPVSTTTIETTANSQTTTTADYRSNTLSTTTVSNDVGDAALDGRGVTIETNNYQIAPSNTLIPLIRTGGTGRRYADAPFRNFGSPTPPAPAPTPTYYDDPGYDPGPSPCSCSSGQVDVSTTICNSGCGLQIRTCDGCYWSSQTCDNNRRPSGVPATETSCSDNLDNNCDGNEADYDGGTIKNKGDPNCKVALSSVSTVVNNPNENDVLEVTCNANAGNLRSIKASIGGIDCTAGVKTGNSYRFNCNIGTVAQDNPGKEVKCYVDSSRSYQEGTDKTVNVDVCKLISAEWSNPSARQYEDVRLNVITTQGCNGKEVKFFVKNVLTGRNAAFAPRSASVVNGRATSTWTVEFESLNGRNPLYYFTAAID